MKKETCIYVVAFNIRRLDDVGELWKTVKCKANSEEEACLKAISGYEDRLINIVSVEVFCKCK